MSKNELLEAAAPAPETVKASVSCAPPQDSHTSHPVSPSSLPSVAPSPHPSIPLSLQPLPLNALAALLGCTRSTIRHFADRFGFRYTVRCIGPRHQRIACLTPDQAQLIATELERETSSSSASSLPTPGDHDSTARAESNNPSIQQSNKAAEGLFYLLQLEPERDPGRFKLGFSSDLESRLDDLLTVVPLARLIAAWPAQRSWERTAIISTAQNAEPLSQEVFRADRLEDAVAAADRFFAVMPQLHPPPIADGLPIRRSKAQSASPYPIDTSQPTAPAPAPPPSPRPKSALIPPDLPAAYAPSPPPRPIRDPIDLIPPRSPATHLLTTRCVAESPP